MTDAALMYYHNLTTGEDTLHAAVEGRRVGSRAVTPPTLVDFLVAATVPLEVERWVARQSPDNDTPGPDDRLLFSVEVTDRGTVGICRSSRVWLSRLNYFGVN